MTLIVTVAFFYVFSEIISYILIAWVLSMIGAPVVKFLRKYVGKNIAAGLTLGLFGVLFILLVWMFIPPLSIQAGNIASIDYSKVIKSLEEPLDDWESWLGDKGLVTMSVPEEKSNNSEENEHIKTKLISIDSLLKSETALDSNTTNQNITLLIQIDGRDLDNDPKGATEENDNASFFDKTKESLYSFLNPSIIPKLLTSIIGTLGNFVIGLFSVVFIAFFFLKEQGLFNNMIATIIPDKYEKQSFEALTETSNLLIRYFIGVLLQMTIITLFVSILLSILGVKNALLIGFFAALMNVIPYVGPIIGAGFAVIITTSSNLDVSFYDVLLPQLIKVFGVFATMQMLDNFILQPNIFSKSVKAHPLEIFIVILIGAKIGGVGGMVLAIPVYTVLRVVLKVFLSEFKVVQRITRGL